MAGPLAGYCHGLALFERAAKPGRLPLGQSEARKGDSDKQGAEPRGLPEGRAGARAAAAARLSTTQLPFSGHLRRGAGGWVSGVVTKLTRAREPY